MEGELLRLGPLAIYSYGTALAAAFLVGTALTVREGRRRGFEPQLLTDLAIRVILVGIAAGRLGYCLPDIGYYITHPLELLRVPQGGLSYLPALAAALWYAGRVARNRQWQFAELCDAMAPGLAVGIVVGCLGAFEAQPEEGAVYLGTLAWAPPTLVFFTLEYAGLWYLAASRRRQSAGRRFLQVLTVDAAARCISSAWAWRLTADWLPHGLSLAVSALMLALVGGAQVMLARREANVVAGTGLAAAAGDETVEQPRAPRRRRPPARQRLKQALVWGGVYLACVLLLGRTVV